MLYVCWHIYTIYLSLYIKVRFTEKYFSKKWHNWPQVIVTLNEMLHRTAMGKWTSAACHVTATHGGPWPRPVTLTRVSANVSQVSKEWSAIGASHVTTASPALDVDVSVTCVHCRRGRLYSADYYLCTITLLNDRNN